MNRQGVSLRSLPVVALLLWTLACSRKPSLITGNSTNDAHFQRIVCFKFKPNTSEEEKQRHMRSFARMKDSIPDILSYAAGTTIKGEAKTEPEYDVMHYMTFQSEEAIQRYSTHAVHRRFINENRGIWENFYYLNSKIK